MNHCYRLVFNQCLQIWQAVAESAKSHRKSGGKSLAKVTLSALFFSAVTYNVGVLAEPNTHALPSGGVVTAGQSTISQNGANLNILQSTQKSIINWASYNIGAGASVNMCSPMHKLFR